MREVSDVQRTRFLRPGARRWGILGYLAALGCAADCAGEVDGELPNLQGRDGSLWAWSLASQMPGSDDDARVLDSLVWLPWYRAAGAGAEGRQSGSRPATGVLP